MRRGWVVALALVVGATVLGGCGDPEKKYCDQLRADQSELGTLTNSQSPSALITGRELLQDLADRAPEDLVDEWQTFMVAVDGYADAVRRAGLKPSQLADGIPSSVSSSKKKAIQDAAAALGSDDVVQAAEGIESQARDVCKIDLGL